MKPLPFQKQDVLKTEREFKSRCLLAWDMGLGKTPFVFWWMLRNKKRALPGIVVCPSSVKPQWERTAIDFGFEAMVLEGRGPKKVGKRYEKLPPKDLYILNFDIVSYWKQHLKKLYPGVTVIDEAQNCANYTQRTRACLSLCYNSDYALCLTGTPIMNKTTEMFYILNMLRPDVFESKVLFEEEYAQYEMDYWGRRRYVGAKNTEQLNQLCLDTCMIRRRKEDVLDQLPEKNREVVPLEISNRREYNEAKTNFLQWLKSKDAKRAKRASKVVQLAKIGYLLRLVAKLKIRSAVEWVDTLLESREKVLVFANHTKALDVFQNRSSVASVRVDGKVRGKKREEAIEEFVNGKTRLLVGNIKALGTGVDRLQHICSDAVFFELPWNPAVLRQAEDRLWRMGQGKNVWCWYLVAYRTVEEKLCETLRMKQQDFEAVVDGRSDNSSELDVLDVLVHELEKED